MKQRLEQLDELLEWGGTRKAVVLLVLGGLSLILSLVNSRLRLWSLPFDPAWIAVILCGVPIVLEALIGLVTRFDIKADVLVAMALVASVCIGEIFAAGEVAFIMQLGELLEDVTVDRARSGIEKLVRLTPRTARVLRNGTETVIPAEEVQVGDLLRVLPGETGPVDGVIRSGQTSINQAVMTGESLPVDKTVGDPVSSGTVNQFGAFEMEASRVGEDSSIQRMIRLVQSADADKAKIVRLADRWATWIVVAALTAAVITGLVTGELIRAVTVLVVFCPCALVLATPTAIMAAIGNAGKHGFLVKEGDALERLARVRCVTFDKTGTLTYGTPAVTAAGACEGWTEEEVFKLAASAETLSEHPLAKAVVKSWGKETVKPEDFQMIPGQGVSARVDERTVLAGNPKLLEAHGIHLPKLEEVEYHLCQGSSVIYVAVDGTFAGWLALADTLREEAGTMLRAVEDLGVTPVLLTGDNQSAAGAVAGKLGLREVRAGCLPEDKLTYIGEYQAAGQEVCMIGDGVNDAPALKKANVGIAMGGVGSDIAVDAADIALVDDEIKELPHLLALSRRMMTTIKGNLTFSMALNFLAIALAIAGVLGPVTGALVHNAGSVLVIGNSALLLKWRKRQ